MTVEEKKSIIKQLYKKRGVDWIDDEHGPNVIDAQLKLLTNEIFRFVPLFETKKPKKLSHDSRRM